MSFSFLDALFAVFVLGFLAKTCILGDVEQVFGRDTTASLRGLAMMSIMIHHMHSRLQGNSPILLVSGYLSVGLFFFISGYGNMLSMNKCDKLKFDWMLKKVQKLYIPFLVAYWIYYILVAIMKRAELPLGKELIIDLVTMSLPNKDTWFVKIILLCFLIHWIAKRLFTDSVKQNAFILVVILFYVCVSYKMGVKTQWYTTIACYPLGCIFAKPVVFKRVIDFFRKHKKLGFILFAVLTVAGVALTNRFWKVTLICPIVFSLACYYFSCIFDTKTKFLAWVGNNSFEFYLFHYIFLWGFSSLCDTNLYAYSCGILMCVITLVFVYLQSKSKIDVRKKILVKA